RTLNNYLEKQNLLPKFMAYAAKNGVRKKDGDLKKSEHLLKIELNAYIARNILDNEGFYPIIMNIDNTLQRAIRVIAKEK
ncbi:MAG: peptidase S41, partial [Bacteroidota bacterium]|nr:peptidase S41 [Bacteroidota bacterium]